MAEIIENGILIREVDVKGIMTKSSLPVGGILSQPICGLHSWLQILLCLIYEEVHRPY